MEEVNKVVNKKEPAWVCLDCAAKREAKVPYGHCPTWHPDTCCLCGEYRYVTEPRDFGKTRHLLKTKINEK